MPPFSAGSTARLVHELAQPDGGVLDIAVFHLPSPHLGGKQPAAVHPREVAVVKLVPCLGVFGCLVIHAKVPVSVFIPAVASMNSFSWPADGWCSLQPSR